MRFNIHFYVTFLEGELFTQFNYEFVLICVFYLLSSATTATSTFVWYLHLSIKWIGCQLVDALELPSVALLHEKAVLRSRKDFDLMQLVESTPREVSLPHNINEGGPLPWLAKPGHLLLVGVGVDHLR